MKPKDEGITEVSRVRAKAAIANRLHNRVVKYLILSIYSTIAQPYSHEEETMKLRAIFGKKSFVM